MKHLLPVIGNDDGTDENNKCYGNRGKHVFDILNRLGKKVPHCKTCTQRNNDHKNDLKKHT